MNKKSLKLVSAMLFLSGLPSGYIQTALGTTVAGIQVIQHMYRYRDGPER